MHINRNFDIRLLQLTLNPMTVEVPTLLVEKLETRYGIMFILKQDKVIGRSLKFYGEWAEHEISIFQNFIRHNTTVIDVGANIGTHSIAFATTNPSINVIAIEALPIAFSILQMNCLINGLKNIYPHHLLIGKRKDMLILSDKNINWENIGSFSFTDTVNLNNKNSIESDSLKRNDNITFNKNLIPIIKLDLFQIEEPVSLIKIDVEGMELDVLQGSLNTIRKHRPIVFAEQLDTKSLKKTNSFFKKLNYKTFWLETHPFNSNNYRCQQENIWWRTEMGILGVPDEFNKTIDLPTVTGREESIPYRLNAREGIKVLY